MQLLVHELSKCLLGLTDVAQPVYNHAFSLLPMEITGFMVVAVLPYVLSLHIVHLHDQLILTACSHIVESDQLMLTV